MLALLKVDELPINKRIQHNKTVTNPSILKLFSYLFILDKLWSRCQGTAHLYDFTLEVGSSGFFISLILELAGLL